MKLHGHDRVLMGVVAALLTLGLIMVLSASGPVAAERAHDAWYFVKRQALAMFLGLALGTVVAVVPYRWLNRYVWAAYVAVVLALIGVLLPGVGTRINGAQRWIGVGGLHLQPAEFAKVVTILCMAWFLDRNMGRLHQNKTFLRSLAIPLPVMILVLMEPDFGSTAIIALLVFLMLCVAGLPSRRIWALGGALVVIGAPAMMLASYRARRFRGFLDPWADAGGSGYQVIQSMIAFSSGGLTGQGLGESHAKHMFLPEPWTDFIGSVLAEELGLLGVLGMLALYAVFVWRGMRIARRAPDMFGMLLAAAITALIAGQAILNIGMAMGVLPPKGLVLPFLSYGGTAVLLHLVSVGILLNISANGRAEMNVLSPYRRAAVAEGVLG